MLREPFFQCDILSTGDEFIFREKTADPNTVPRGEGVQWWLINVTFTFNLIHFCCRIFDKHNKIMLIMIIPMNNTI